MGEHAKGELCLLRARALELLDPRGLAGEAEEARFELERTLDLVEVELPCAQQVQHDLDVDRPRTGPHRDALEGAVAHRRIHGATVEYRGHRAAPAEMADDESRHPHLLGRPPNR